MKYPGMASGHNIPFIMHLTPTEDTLAHDLHVLSKVSSRAAAAFPYAPTSHIQSPRAMAPPSVDESIGHALHSLFPFEG